MAIRSPDRTRSLARAVGPTVLSGAVMGLLVYALVAGAPPLYQSEATIAAAAPALLEQYHRITTSGTTGAANATGADHRIGPDDLGDVRDLVDRVRAHRGSRAASSEIGLRIDDAAGEVRVIARGHHRQTTRLMANDIAAGIVGGRDVTTAKQHESVEAELRLVAMLARTSPRMRSRANALRTRLAALDQLRQTPGGGLTVLRQARTPTEPIAPRVMRDVVLAVVAGMLGWVTLSRLRPALVRERRARAVAI